MKLQPDLTSIGTWVNPAWTPGTPGLFALVVGVSEYSHLDPQDPQSLGLGSLPVSALTAFRFFEWLDANYHYEGVPLATCRLLLSPTRDELALAPEMATHQQEPVFSNCETAIGDWFAQMDGLSLQAAEKSRSVFFFSGHGLEITEEQQVLLPKDYLDPRRPSYDRAIGTSNLRRGLKALKVPLHFVFLDACRNDHDNLRQQDPLEGARILNPVSGQRRNPRCFVPLFFATAAGRQAFQPPHPSRGISLFGRALLEGLDGRKGMFLECASESCQVKLDPLMALCMTRIPQIAKDEFNEVIEQEVRISGDYTTQPVTQIQGKRAGGLMSVATGRRAFHDEQLSEVVKVPSNFRPLDATAHAIFRHETVTYPMIGARVFADGQGWLDKPGDFVVTNVRMGAGGRNELELAPLTHDTVWLEMTSISGDEKFGIVLPNDGRPELRHLLELEVLGGGITHMAASLSWRNVEPYRMAASIWNSYRDESLGEAVYQMTQSPQELEAVLEAKAESPLSASIAAMLLVRGREWARLHDWPRNLANRFPLFTDGAVLWAELLLQKQEGEPAARREAFEYLASLRDRRLPVLSPVLAMAYQRIQEFAEDSDLDTSSRQLAKMLLRRFSRPIRHLRPGSLYTVFSGSPDVIHPAMVMPNLPRGN